MIRSLADRDDIVDQDDGSYVWLEPAGNFQRSVGTMSFDEKRVVLETTSQKRAEKARDELANLFGGAARFRAISYEDVEQALKRAPQTSKQKEPDIPVEEQRKILGRVLRESLPQVARRAGAGSRQPHAAPRRAIEDGASQVGRAAQGF